MSCGTPAFVQDLWDVVRGDAGRSSIGRATSLGDAELLNFLARIAQGICSPLNTSAIAEHVGLGSHHTVNDRVNDLVFAFQVWKCHQIGTGGRPNTNRRRKVCFVDPLIARIPSERQGAYQPPDISKLSEQQLGLSLLRSATGGRADAFMAADDLMYERTSTADLRARPQTPPVRFLDHTNGRHAHFVAYLHAVFTPASSQRTAGASSRASLTVSLGLAASMTGPRALMGTSASAYPRDSASPRAAIAQTTQQSASAVSHAVAIRAISMTTYVRRGNPCLLRYRPPAHDLEHLVTGWTGFGRRFSRAQRSGYPSRPVIGARGPYYSSRARRLRMNSSRPPTARTITTIAPPMTM